MSETLSVSDTSVADAAANNVHKKVILKIFASFTYCISEINNTHEKIMPKTLI